MATIGKVSAVFTASTSGLRTGVSQAISSMSRMETAVASMRRSMLLLNTMTGANLFGGIVSSMSSLVSRVGGMAQSLASSISVAVNEATSLGEETSKSGVLFGQAAGQIAQFAKSASAIGLSESAALQATGTFGNLFKAMGLGVDVSAEYSTTLTKLGADLASFNNSTVDDAIMAIGAALRGESEPIRRFGVLLDEATLKQEAMNAGLVQSTKGSLTPAIKAQAAYAAILRQTIAAQGDFARTSGSLANLGRVVGAQATNIMGDVGKAFQPLFTSATSAISKVLEAVRPFVQSVAEGVSKSLSVIGTAIESLVPAFSAFLGGLDGGAIGERIGNGIIAGARYIARVIDYMTTAVPAAWKYVQGLAQYWSTVFDIGRRVFSFFGIIGRSFEFYFKMGGSLLNGLIGRLMNAAGELTQLATFGAYGKDTEKAGAKLMKLSTTLWDESLAASKAAAQNVVGVFTSGAQDAGKEMAGPLTTALDSALSVGNSMGDAIDQALKTPVQVEASPVAAEVAKSVAQTVNKAVEGVDSKSAEGLKTMFRIMRGDTGNDVQEKQLDELRGIRREIGNNNGAAGGAIPQFDVFDLAPAAGA